ncbi:MAG: hypothetical protein COV67_08700 [Nitrospinae bacterium CG11_big_fil_rev_8_21_14_0_20_56_8]|nr:MAG: hypothetical protein COV67_08700 [Nitrospinae bacterium CG11_big_fil_rev_8_21_14_0_20_56_8]
MASAKILVADDSITIQKIVAMAFENEEETVEGIGDGQKAFEKMSTFKPDVVLADVEMPGLNGYELSRKIKESAEFASTRVLLLASDFEDFDEAAFHSSKADGHINKPFKSEEIISTVRSLLASGSVSGGEEAAIELSPDQMLEEDGVISLSEEDMASAADAISLTADDLAEDDSSETIELSATEMVSEEDAGVIALSEEDALPEADEIGLSETDLAEGDAPETIELTAGELAPEDESDAVLLSTDDLAEENTDKWLEDTLDLSAEEIMEEPVREEKPEAKPSEPAKEPEKPAEPEKVESKSTGLVREEIPDAAHLKPEREKNLDEMLDTLFSFKNESESQTAIKEKNKRVIEEMMRDAESLRELSTSSREPEKPSLLKSAHLPNFPDHDDDLSESISDLQEPPEGLDEAFAQVRRTGSSVQRFQPMENGPDLPGDMENIVAEPEDLLEKMAPAAYSYSKGVRPDLIRDSISFMARLPGVEPTPRGEPGFPSERGRSLMAPGPVPETDRFVRVVGEHIKGVLEKSLDTSLEKEIDGLSEAIVQSVRDLVREITPAIARALIQEEIERIKRLEER